MAAVFGRQNIRRVYCAGPLFNRAEREEMERIAAVLTRGGFEPFVPHADGMEFAELHPYLVAQGCEPLEVGQLLHAAIFALDVYQVVIGCGCLVFNMNGRVPDEGAVAEATMAWMLNKPVVIYKDDARTAISCRDNPLVVGPAGFKTVSELEALAAALEKKITEQQARPLWQLPCPPHLEPTLAAGARLWEELEKAASGRDLEEVSRVVCDLFAPPAIGGNSAQSASLCTRGAAAEDRLRATA